MRRKNCYVIMPFIKEYNTLYYAIQSAVDDYFGSNICARADDEKYAGIITSKITYGILNADIVIAVITEGNPNVMYELGIAHSFKKPTILLISGENERQKLPFDISAQESIVYEYDCNASSRDIENQMDTLKRQIREYLIQLDNEKFKPTNPLSQVIDDLHVFVDDFRNWLMGYTEVYEREKEAKIVWSMCPDTHYFTKDKIYNQLVKDGILQENRKYYIMIPKIDTIITEMENCMKRMEDDLGPQNRNKLYNGIRYVSIEPEVFDLMPLDIVLYDPTDPVKTTGIICEPMAPYIGVQAEYYELVTGIPINDWVNISNVDKWKEKSFDIRLDERKVRSLVGSFQKRWNSEIEKSIRETDKDEIKTFLKNNWLI